MADATPTTTPADDGRAYVQPNGKVDTGGRPAFVWCEDTSTGHRFDLSHRALPKKGVKVIEGYPLNFKRFGRRGKTRLELPGDPAETDVTGTVDAGQTPAEPAGTGDQAHAEAAAAAPDLVDGVPTDQVEKPAPEISPSGDDQHAAAAAEPEAGAGDDAATTKTRRTR